MTHGNQLFQRTRLPTPGEILEVLQTMPYEAEPCYYRPCRGRRTSDTFSCETCNRSWDFGDQPPDPERCETGEVWIETMGVWINYDGRFYSADQGRGNHYPNWFWAWRLRRAIRAAMRQRGRKI